MKAGHNPLWSELFSTDFSKVIVDVLLRIEKDATPNLSPGSMIDFIIRKRQDKSHYNWKLFNTS